MVGRSKLPTGMFRMIAGIDSQADIELYLKAEEIEQLSDSTIDGILIKRKTPKYQGTISVSINETRKMENGFGIGLDDSKYWEKEEDYHIDVFIGDEYYQKLKDRGVVSPRQSLKDGAKITIYDESRISGMDCILMEGLEFYRDNKEKLR